MDDTWDYYQPHTLLCFELAFIYGNSLKAVCNSDNLYKTVLLLQMAVSGDIC